MWEYVDKFLEAAANTEQSMKEEYRIEPTLEYCYADKMMWPRPLAPKIKGETVIMGDLIEKEYLKCYFNKESRFEELKIVCW